MNQRTKIIIGAAGIIIVLVIAALVWWFIFNRPAQPGPTNTNESADILERIPVSGAPKQTEEPPIVNDRPEIASAIKAIARTFTERYGSYSNESNFSNLKDLTSLMTDTMSASVDAYIQDQAAANTNGYYGITTNALSATIIAVDDALGKAEVRVSTQRQEATGNTANPRTFYQDIVLQLVNINGSWKVDQAQWQ